MLLDEPRQDMKKVIKKYLDSWLENNGRGEVYFSKFPENRLHLGNIWSFKMPKTAISLNDLCCFY